MESHITAVKDGLMFTSPFGLDVFFYRRVPSGCQCTVVQHRLRCIALRHVILEELAQHGMCTPVNGHYTAFFLADAPRDPCSGESERKQR